MARSKGDFTRVTFVALVAYLADREIASRKGTDREIDADAATLLAYRTINALADRTADGDSVAEKALDDLRAAMERDAKGPRSKPGRKGLLSEEEIASITREVLARFKQPNGAPFTPEAFAALPEGPARTALGSQIAAAIKAERTARSAAREIAKLAAATAPLSTAAE